MGGIYMELVYISNIYYELVYGRDVLGVSIY